MKPAPRSRRVARVLGVAIASALAMSMHGASADDSTSRYFSYSFGAQIDRVAAGADGRLYIAGWTPTTDLPASTSHPDLLPPRSVDYGNALGFVFVSALDASGLPLWTSYLPAGGGYYNDVGIGGLTVGADGSVWLAGVQRIAPLAAFHTATPDTYDGFVAKFSRDGELVVATYLDDRALEESPSTWIEDVVVDASGDAYVAGSTWSPTLDGAPVDASNGFSGFLSRIRGDGSGVVWTRWFDGRGYYAPAYCGGVAFDAATNTVLVSYAGPQTAVFVPPTTVLTPPEGFRQPAYRWRSSQAVGAARFDVDGNPVAGALLAFLDEDASSGCGIQYGVRIPIAIDADGSVLVGGSHWIARLSPELEAALAVEFGVHSPRRITPDGRGNAFVVSSYPQCAWQGGTGVLSVLGHDLAPRPNAPVLRNAHFVKDLVLDPAGDLAFAGTWSGTPFNAPADARPSTEWDNYNTITKVPLHGVCTPTRFRVRARDADTLDMTWSADGDPVVRFELADVTGDGTTTSYPTRHEIAGDVAPAATSYRADGVTPGARHDVELISVFANGVRSAIGRMALTPPARSAKLAATRAGGLAVDVTWQDPNGRECVYSVQRRVGSGPWIGLEGAATDATIGEPAVLFDLVPDVAEEVSYRVRARAGRGVRTPWTTSAPIPPSASLRVTPVSGEFNGGQNRVGRFVLEGRLTRMDGTPGAPFDPTSQDLRLLFGDASAPVEFAIAAGDPGWTPTGGTWTWSAVRTLNPWTAQSEVVISPADGTFRVALESGAIEMTQRSGAVAFNLGLGDLSGGDVRAWVVRGAKDAPYTLGPAVVRAGVSGR